MSILFSRLAVQSLKKAATLFGADCVLCGAAESGEVCADCTAALQRVGNACPRCAAVLCAFDEPCGACLRHPPAFDAARCAFTYRFPLERLVARYKYGGDVAIGKWLASQLANAVMNEPPPDLLVVPPLARERMHERGFNQALEIAKAVGRRLGLRVDAHVVRRARESAPQASLTRRERLANLRGAFRCDARLDGLDIAVVDDVMTTGATAEAMALALKAAGAARVRIWAVARTPEPGR